MAIGFGYRSALGSAIWAWELGITAIHTWLTRDTSEVIV